MLDIFIKIELNNSIIFPEIVPMCNKHLSVKKSDNCN